MESSWPILSVPYGSSAPAPFWGSKTSAVNFCEEDYILTHYVAEFFNTLTSLAYIGYGIHGIIRYKRRNASILSSDNIPYFGLMGVGLASACYHGTLKYHTQMADEMAMHLAIGCVMIQVFNFRQSAEIKRRNATIIVVGLTSFIIYHCITDEFLLHCILFIALAVTVTWKIRAIIGERITDKDQKRKLLSLATFSTCTALFAYFLWNLDVHFCPTITRWKRQLGMPWGFILELHGYWHILTSISSYTFMAMSEYITCPEHEVRRGVGFAWPAKVVLEDLIPKTAAQDAQKLANGHTTMANGHANGSVSKRKKRG